jgi:chloride channel protein, CIC family
MTPGGAGRPTPSARLRRWREWASSLEFALARRFGLATREERLFFVLIGVVGIIGGLLGVATEGLIQAVQRTLWGYSGDLLGPLMAHKVPVWVVIGAPTCGGVLVGLILWLGRQPPGGEGMAMLIEAVALSSGRIPARPVLVDALTAVATVGSGGSLGKEGPMIRVGAMLSSLLGQRLGLPPHRVKILVGCGAAAGLAATYNIPIGGALFAMEVILGNFALEIFGPIVASSVIATVIARSVVGNVPFYAAPGYTLKSGWELLPYAGLGIVGAFASLAFVFGIGAARRLFKRMTLVPRPLRPILGMALVGVLGLYAPYALGRGYGTINLLLSGQLHLPARLGLPHEFTILLLLVLALAKLLATALTSGSGGSGGLFTPSLAFGALVGAAYGYSIHWLWPQIASPYGAYAAVGMVAVMAGTSHAPISAILILFEFTGNYDLILPVMLAAIIASLLAKRLRRYSIYTEALRGRGIELPWRMEEAVLAGLKAADLVRPDAEVLHPGDHYRKVVETFLSGRRQRLFVVGEDRRLLGAISLHDIKHVLEHPEALTAVVAHDLMVPVGTVVRKDERLHRATQLFASSEYERLPVVDDEGRLLGVLAKRDLLAVYAQEVLGRPAVLATFVSSGDSGGSRQYVELPPDFSLRTVPVPPEIVGRSLAEVRLPQTLGARVIEIRRQGRQGEEPVIPSADTVLEAGDMLVIIGPTGRMESLSEGKTPLLDEALAHSAID